MAVESVLQPHRDREACFDYFWQQQGEWVEAPNQRRGGESGVQRLQAAGGGLLYAKRQVGHIYRNWLYPLGRPTVLRERDALLAMRELQVRTPQLVFSGARRESAGPWQALLVTAALEGFSEIDTWYAEGGRERDGEAVHERLLQTVAQALASMHRGRWQHGCLYSKHVFVRVAGAGEAATVEVALLDFEKARQRLTARQAAVHDLRQLRRHSSWNATDWAKLGYFYERAFGSSFKGLW